MSEPSNRGLLTTREREYLRTGDPGGSNPRKLRQQIRERIRSCFADLGLLAEQLEPRDLSQTAELEDGTFATEFRNEYVDTIAFLVRLAESTDEDLDDLLWEGLYNGLQLAYPEQICEIVVRTNTHSYEEIIEKIRRKLDRQQQLTDTESRILLENAFRFREELTAILEEQRKPDRISLERQVRDNPGIVEDGLEIIDESLPEHPVEELPDIICRDKEGTLVLLQLETEGPKRRNYTRLDHQLSKLVDDYGGPERVRGIVATLADVEEIQRVTRDSPIEYVSLADVVSTSESPPLEVDRDVADDEETE